MNSAERSVLDHVDRLADEMVAFTRALIQVPTINPPGEAYAACAALVSDHLSALGYDVEILNDTQPSVVGTLRGDEPGRVLHFNGHYDVVPPGAGWSVDPFGGVIRGSRIYGRGACDQKGGIAASIYAVEALRRAGVPWRGAIEQSATPDEETGGFGGVGYLCDVGRISRARQDYVIITEPLDPDRVCIGYRGVYWFEVTTHGSVGHGSMPSLAQNAADSMLWLLNAIDADLRPRLVQRRTTAPVAPPEARAASISLNALHAGQPLGSAQSPCVPDTCTAVFDRRFLHEEAFDDVKAEIQALLQALSRAHPTFRYEMRDLMRVDPLLGRADTPLVSTAVAAIHDVLGTTPAIVASPGTYDHKHVVLRAGLQDACIAYGPGRLANAHQADEFLEIGDLIASARVMSIVALRLLG